MMSLANRGSLGLGLHASAMGAQHSHMRMDKNPKRNMHEHVVKYYSTLHPGCTCDLACWHAIYTASEPQRGLGCG